MAAPVEYQRELQAAKSDRPNFLEFRQSEVMKDNIQITDQIFEDLKEIHALQREKRRLLRERFDTLEDAHPKQYAMVKDRSTMSTLSSPQEKERCKWERQRDVITKMVFKVGQYIQVQKEYVNTANDTIHRFIGDRIKHLLNTKIEYVLYLIKQLTETSSGESKQKCLLQLPSFITPNKKDKQKKLNQLKCELDKDLLENCQAFQEHMRKVLGQCSTSENLWNMDTTTKDRHKYRYTWNKAFTKPVIPQKV